MSKNNIQLYKNKPFLLEEPIENAKQALTKAKTFIVPIRYGAHISVEGKLKTEWQKRLANGPDAIIAASNQLIEIFHLGSKLDLVQILRPITLEGLYFKKEQPEKVAQIIFDYTKQLLTFKQTKNKLYVFLGGHHGISFGTIVPFIEKYGADNISILQFDAHADLRNAYDNSSWNHACVMRRIHEKYKIPIVNAGVRSVSHEDYEYLQKNKSTLHWISDVEIIKKSREKNGLTKIAQKISQHLKKNVIISFDLDTLKPEIMPYVTTPHPIGLELSFPLEIIQHIVNRHRVVSLDIVEFAPPNNPETLHPAVTAAWLIIEICLQIIKNKES